MTEGPREPSVIAILLNGKTVYACDFYQSNLEGAIRRFTRMWGDDRTRWPEFARDAVKELEEARRKWEEAARAH